MPIFTSKVTPAHQEYTKIEETTEKRGDENATYFRMFVMLLHIFFQQFEARRHPEVRNFETYMKENALTELAYVPPQSTIIYISHEWVGTDHPDPRGNQMYHLVLLLERLRRGDVSRTDMDAFHSLIYKHNYTTTADDWKRLLDPQKTYIFYDGFCVPKDEREQGFRRIPEIIKRCDFMIILAPGCTHFDKIDPKTGRKMNLCYRTYRLHARCVYEMFSAFLTRE